MASGRVFHQLLDGQLVNELVRHFLGTFQPPFLSLCVPGCCLIHDTLVKMWCRRFVHAPATPHLWCWFLCVGNNNNNFFADSQVQLLYVLRELKLASTWSWPQYWSRKQLPVPRPYTPCTINIHHKHALLTCTINSDKYQIERHQICHLIAYEISKVVFVVQSFALFVCFR